MRIDIDDLSRPAVHDLLREHLAHMHELSPPEQVFALDVSKLRSSDITFWTVWDGGQLLGCGALKALSATHGEIKSMRTPAALRGRGAGRLVLQRIIETARQRKYSVLSLETGTHPAFRPAQQLYRSAGFAASGPFAGYAENPHSMFMQLRLAGSLLEGACHCGAVRLTLPSAPDTATNCNCSLCRRIGGPWVYYAFGTVQIDGHPQHTAAYVWGDKTLRTLHCTHCGCVTHWEPLVVTPAVKHGVNLGNFDPALAKAVRVRRFDGADSWTFVD